MFEKMKNASVMGTLKSVCSSWIGLISRDILYEHTNLRLWISEKKPPLLTYALSFYGSKMILDRPNHFGRVPIVLVGTNSFWSGPNHYGQVKIIKISNEKSNLNLTKIMRPRPKQFGQSKIILDL